MAGHPGLNDKGVAYLTGLFFQQVVKGAEFRAPITIHLPSHDLEVTGSLCGRSHRAG